MPEMVKLRCPNLLCRVILSVPVIMRGQHVRCANCGEVLLVPRTGGAPAVSRSGAPAADSASR